MNDSFGDFPAQKSGRPSGSPSKNEEAVMINQHYNYILGQILCPDFKAMVNWHNLSKEHVAIEQKTL